LLILPLTHIQKFRGLQFYPINQLLFWLWINTTILLTWIGARPVEAPYDYLGAILTFIYFLYFLLAPVINSLWDNILLTKY
jgi:ubiquinol-cytochrome c reductase cytochrome b subunit